MKIAMIGHKRMPSREGGVEIVVEELATRLVKDGHQVDVYNRKGKNVQDKRADTEKRKLKEYKGVRLITIPTINKKGIDALLYSFFATIRALFCKYDIIHYHSEGPCAMLWIPHILGIKTVATIHGLDWQRSKWGIFATKYLKFGEKIAAKYADEIIVLSKGVQNYFQDTYNRNTNFIPNGVNEPKIKKANIIKEKYGLSKNSYILFLARIVPEKGLHYLIDAYKKIDTDKQLVIAGGASHTNGYLEEIKEKIKNDDRIIMTGFVQGQELEELYSNCYLYCLPSDVEGMPISLLEAMSYGCKCLVSNIEENTQIIENYATTFKKGNIEDLKEKLKVALNNNDTIDNKDQIKHILEKNSWDKVLNETKKLYNNNNNRTINIINIITFIVISLNLILPIMTAKLIDYICVYIMITLFFIKSNNCKLKLNVSLLMVGFYTLMIGICPMIGIINKGIFYEKQYAIIIMGYLIMIIGYMIMKSILKNKSYKKISSSNNYYDKIMKTFGIILIVASIISAIYYIAINKNIIMELGAENGRIKAMSGNGLILQILKLSILAGAILFEQYMKGNMTKKGIVIVSCAVILINIITGFRSGIFTYLLIVMLIYNKKTKLNIKKIILILIPMFVVLMLFGALRGGILSGNNNSFLSSSLTTLQAGSINLNWILNKFPTEIEYQKGYTYLINIIMLKPGPDLDFTLWLKQILNVNFNGGGITPTILGEFYLNFGYIGIYIGMFVFGIVLFLLENQYKKTNNLSLNAFIIVMFMGAFRGGIANIEINTIIGILTYCVFNFIAKYTKNYVGERK